MTILVDASALVAMATDEPEAVAFLNEMRRHIERYCCSSGIWEAALAIGRKRKMTASAAGHALDRFRADFNIGLVAVGDREARLAIEAHDQYGKGTGHPARLNMGDCFAYACAKANNARLLYKGDDFSHTDLA